MKNLVCALLSLALFLFCTPLKAENFEKELNQIEAKTKKLFNAKDWAALDDYADTAHIKKQTLSNGLLLFDHIQAYLNPSYHLEDSDTDATWEKWYASYDEWEAASPNSLLIPTARILYWVNFAWKARGGGYANTVGADDWKLFSQRLDKAKTIFDQEIAPLNGKPYPNANIYSAAMSIALGQGWDIQKCYDELLTPSIAASPESTFIHGDITNFLQTKWHGAQGDDYRFYKTIPGRIGGELGKEMYARVLVFEKIHELTNYRPDLVDWELAKEGMIVAMQRYPESTHLLTSFVKFAHRYNEHKALVAILKDTAPEAVARFYESSPYGNTFALEADSPASVLTPIRYFKVEPALGGDLARTPVKRAGTDNLLVSFGHRGVHEISLPEGKIIKHRPATPRYIKCIATSPDGRHMLFSSGADKNHGHNNTLLQIRSTDDDWTVDFSTEFKLGYVYDCIFTPDSSKIIFGYTPPKIGNKKPKSSTYIWDWQIPGSKPEILLADLKQVHDSYTIDPATNTLYYKHSRTIYKLDLAHPAEQPTVLSKSIPKGSRIWDFKIIDGGKTCLVLSGIKKTGKSLHMLKTEDGSLITTRPLTEIGDDAWLITYAFSKKLNKPIIATCGESGGVITWTIEPDSTIAYQSTISQNGQPAACMATMADEKDNTYIIQGTQNGMLGIYRLD
ncbi:hypothetical protein [Luteolibacter sp. AS25]|uniref:hypothetical protein n=1 Tax=Luteolibacter sp. AS25 TaxID=3135776 RepID=UPI00398B875F